VAQNWVPRTVVVVLLFLTTGCAGSYGLEEARFGGTFYMPEARSHPIKVFGAGSEDGTLWTQLLSGLPDTIGSVTEIPFTATSGTQVVVAGKEYLRIGMVDLKHVYRADLRSDRLSRYINDIQSSARALGGDAIIISGYQEGAVGRIYSISDVNTGSMGLGKMERSPDGTPVRIDLPQETPREVAVRGIKQEARMRVVVLRLKR
jgi:hypothetical protein